MVLEVCPHDPYRVNLEVSAGAVFFWRLQGESIHCFLQLVVAADFPWLVTTLVHSDSITILPFSPL